MRQAIVWTDCGLVFWRRYASLGLNELINHIITVFNSVMSGLFDVNQHSDIDQS